ncbi:MAG: amidohydrolase family protein [Pseudomonadota bacterium]|nr:amidohydrolase family protein [Pseudomonadota bacterium]
MSDAALDLLKECAGDDRFKGLKLHFANSRADLSNPAHIERMRAVFAAANVAGLAIVVHARDGDDYGAAEARTFIDELLPAAPDVTVQMAHLWGGAALADDALQVYAEAVEAGHPATRRFLFDASDAAFAAQTPEVARLLAGRMRQIGLERILYGSDGAFDGHPDPEASWQAFRRNIPLTDAEFAVIKSNVAPYLRDPGTSGAAR